MGGVVGLLVSYGYLILFLGVIIEGEIFPLAAGFLASAGIMNLHQAIGVTFAGSFLGDLLWFAAARKWGRGLFDRWGRLLFINQKRLTQLENHFARNGKLTLFITKFIYSFGHSSIVVAGLARMDWRELIKVDLPASFLWACLFVFLGKVAGGSFYLLQDWLKDVAWAALLVVVMVGLAQWLIRKRLTKKLGNYDRA